MGERTYRAKTMKEALARVRRDLGGDAVILASREVRRRRLFGLGTREHIEVTASSTMPRHGSPAASDARKSVEDDDRNSMGSGLSAAAQVRFGEQLSRLHAMVEMLSRQGRVDHLVPDLASELVPSYSRLVEAEVPEVLARRLVHHVADTLEADGVSSPMAIQAALCDAVAEFVPVAPPIRAVAGTRRIVALVGPTGVGKTTTVAKLAANFKLLHGIRVGLVTVDTYRIAAVEQLKTYAEIIDLPLAVANDPAEMRRAIDDLGAVEMVFVDTAGRSPRDEVKIRELTAFMAQARPDEVHLVLSAGASHSSLRSAVDRFSQVQADRLILTKLDEAEGFGPILGMLGQANRPVSYLTTGQTVPDDIEPAQGGRLARLVLGLETIG
jgi:flagellar biosynthesis protein FlhF